MIDLNIIKKEERRIEFNVKGINDAGANAIRRSIVSKIPSLAIEDIVIYSNSSAMHDEILAHRLGLIPLKTDLKMYNFADICECEKGDCSLCAVYFELNAEGPKVVYSGDLVSSDPNVAPVYDNMPIVELLDGQKIMLKATARMGNSRWGMKIYNGLGARQDAYNRGEDISAEPGHAKWQAGIASYEKKENGSYDFFVESYGQVDVKEMISRAFELIRDEIKDLESDL